MNKPAHIFFDLDHTLWDFEANSVDTLGELYDQFDLGKKGALLPKDHFITRYVFHNDRMWGLYRANKLSKSRLRSARFEAALRDLQIENKQLAKDVGAAYLESCPRKSKLKDGAFEVVDLLSKAYSLSILSNGFHETQLTKLEVCGLSPYFTEVITSERANAKKPNSRIFHFANVVTKTEKSHSLMIGDNLDIDVKGAMNFGWEALHFNDKAEEEDSITIRHLSRLIDLLLK